MDSTGADTALNFSKIEYKSKRYQISNTSSYITPSLDWSLNNSVCFVRVKRGSTEPGSWYQYVIKNSGGSFSVKSSDNYTFTIETNTSGNKITSVYYSGGFLNCYIDIFIAPNLYTTMLAEANKMPK